MIVAKTLGGIALGAVLAVSALTNQGGADRVEQAVEPCCECSANSCEDCETCGCCDPIVCCCC